MVLFNESIDFPLPVAPGPIVFGGNFLGVPCGVHDEAKHLTLPTGWVAHQQDLGRCVKDGGVASGVNMDIWEHMAVCQNLVPLVNIKIVGKWMFIPLKMYL